MDSLKEIEGSVRSLDGARTALRDLHAVATTEIGEKTQKLDAANQKIAQLEKDLAEKNQTTQAAAQASSAAEEEKKQAEAKTSGLEAKIDSLTKEIGEIKQKQSAQVTDTLAQLGVDPIPSAPAPQPGDQQSAKQKVTADQYWGPWAQQYKQAQGW